MATDAGDGGGCARSPAPDVPREKRGDPVSLNRRARNRLVPAPSC